MNQVVLCGRLVADPRVHVKSDGLHISELRLVTNDRREPEYHDVVTYCWPSWSERTREKAASGSRISGLETNAISQGRWCSA